MSVDFPISMPQPVSIVLIEQPSNSAIPLHAGLASTATVLPSFPANKATLAPVPLLSPGHNAPILEGVLRFVKVSRYDPKRYLGMVLTMNGAVQRFPLTGTLRPLLSP
jgi:hypothetical protein